MFRAAGQGAPRNWKEFSREDLAALVEERILGRGREYWRLGQVAARLVAGNRLAASVLGSAGWYVTQAALAEDGVHTSCTCPYQGGICKHAVALLQAWLAEPSSFRDPAKHLMAKAADSVELSRICLELCLAAPRTAVALLAGESGETCRTEAAIALARNLAVRPGLEAKQPDSLAERLAWVSRRLFPAVARGEKSALAAAVELGEKLLALWNEEAPVRLADPIRDFLAELAHSWPSGEVCREERMRIRDLLRPENRAFAVELARVILAAGGPDDADGAYGRELLELLRRGSASETILAVSFEDLVLLLDAYEREDRIKEAAALARAGLRRSDQAERYVLRRRLARLHEALGEHRQAAALYLADFRVRPDPEGWESLRRAAAAAGDWERIRREIRPVIRGADKELQARAAVEERDPQWIEELSRSLADRDPQSIAVWTAWAEFAPDRALDLFVAAIRAALADGGREARRRAAEFLLALAKVCRRLGCLERLAGLKAGLREEYPPALRWPELGSLLSVDDSDESPV